MGTASDTEQMINKSHCIEFEDCADNWASSRGCPHENGPNLPPGIIITLVQASGRMTGQIE